MAKILITGGSGLIGKTLHKKLISKGHFVTILSRKKSSNPNSFNWNIQEETIEVEAIKSIDYIIHLAGAGIADKRWTRKRKRELVNSRVHSTKLLFNNIKKYNTNLNGFISASGIGYYGASNTKNIFSENDEPGTDFLARVCKLWENEVLKFQQENIRTVIFRTGVVFTKNGGAFEKITAPIKKGIGAVLGEGNQYVPWIYIDDLCELYIKAVENSSFNGIYNAVAPEHTTNKELTFKIATVLKKKIWFPQIPSFVLKLVFGKMAVILLKGSRISSKKIENTGFKFKHSTIKSALNSLLKIN